MKQTFSTTQTILST